MQPGPTAVALLAAQSHKLVVVGINFKPNQNMAQEMQKEKKPGEYYNASHSKFV
jgi:hypothetical protein